MGTDKARSGQEQVKSLPAMTSAIASEVGKALATGEVIAHNARVGGDIMEDIKDVRTRLAVEIVELHNKLKKASDASQVSGIRHTLAKLVKKPAAQVSEQRAASARESYATFLNDVQRLSRGDTAPELITRMRVAIAHELADQIKDADRELTAAEVVSISADGGVKATVKTLLEALVQLADRPVLETEKVTLNNPQLFNDINAVQDLLIVLCKSGLAQLISTHALSGDYPEAQLRKVQEYLERNHLAPAYPKMMSSIE